jgi:thiol-disulfide isomerase/thioredoxin
LRWAISGPSEIIRAPTVRCTVLALRRDPVEDGGVKKHRSILFAAAACLFLFAPFAHAGSAWLNDYKKARQEATATNKFLLSQPQFKDYARENLVLVEVDFPRAKPQSVELRKQNLELAQEYQVQGFPTIVVLDGNGQKLWQYDGYFPDGLDAFIAQLQKLRKG